MGLFSAIKSGLAKTRDALVGELKGIVGAGKITDDTLEELEEHLIKADVGVEAAFLLTDALRENALGKSLTTEQVLDIMRNEAERLLKDPPPFEIKGKPHVVLVIGVNGAGKTTTIGKLAARFKGEGKKVMIAACDTFRAAAIEQLETWAERSGAEFVKHQEGSDPAAVAFDACNAAVARGCDVVLIDTAGRLHNKDYLMEELKKINRVIGREIPGAPHETLLVLDATTGQNAISQADLFTKAAPISGVVLTKLDGTAKGGVVIGIKSELSMPVKWIGVGEAVEDLRPFVAEDFAKALFQD